MGLFTGGLFGGGGFGGMGLGGSQLFGTGLATPGTMTGGQAFSGNMTSDQLLGAMNSSTPGQVQGLYDSYGATEFGNAAAGLGGADQARVGNFMTKNPTQFAGQGSNVATMQGGSPATQGMLTGSGETFNNAARTGLLGYIGYNNVNNANQAMDYMGQNQAIKNTYAAEGYEDDQKTENLDFSQPA